MKHHFERTNLTSNSVDFWKTLKNFVEQDTSSFNSLILHTTANISKSSIFYEWNELTKTKKYNNLKSHSPCDTVKHFYDVAITNYPRKDLLLILERLIIKSSQSNIKDKWEELKNTRFLSYIPEQHKEDAFYWVYAYVNKRAIDNRYKWHIKINDFDNHRQRALSKYTQDKIPFEIIDIEDVTRVQKTSRLLKKWKK
ncbi:conserved hypothetical protein [methanotrophic bacterial endosymbiont of Bathymodiolus sp.]|nr:conserved hypothetical protein [methanotrophic bacterial endosymbiont of Bathymodiolus sp.]